MILIFEGAGWSCANHNGVGNCRIRTRIKNNDGRIIYLELGGHENNDFKGRVDYCFDVVDERTSHTKDLSYIKSLYFPYTKEGILKLVNENLNCSFSSVVVDNDNIRVHETKEPLCSSKGVL